MAYESLQEKVLDSNGKDYFLKFIWIATLAMIRQVQKTTILEQLIDLCNKYYQCYRTDSSGVKWVITNFIILNNLIIDLIIYQLLHAIEISITLGEINHLKKQNNDINNK